MSLRSVVLASPCLPFPMAAFLLALALLGGCVKPGTPASTEPQPTRPNPLDVVDQICIRALSDDAAFLRERLAADFLDHATGERHAALPEPQLIALMHQLRMCRPTSLHKTDQADRVSVRLVGVKDNQVRQFSLDMIYDGHRGWLIAGSLYAEKPLSETAGG